MLTELKVGVVGLVAGAMSSILSIGMWAGGTDADQVNLKAMIDRMDRDSQYLRAELSSIRNDVSDIKVKTATNSAILQQMERQDDYNQRKGG